MILCSRYLPSREQWAAFLAHGVLCFLNFSSSFSPNLGNFNWRSLIVRFSSSFFKCIQRGRIEMILDRYIILRNLENLSFRNPLNNWNFEILRHPMILISTWAKLLTLPRRFFDELKNFLQKTAGYLFRETQYLSRSSFFATRLSNENVSPNGSSTNFLQLCHVSIATSFVIIERERYPRNPFIRSNLSAKRHVEKGANG